MAAMRRALPIVLALLAQAGCKRTLHWKIFEDEITESIAPKLPAGVKLTEATCPETEVVVGQKIRCHIALSDGEQGLVEIELLTLQLDHTMRLVD
jgi:hypothetical protein